MNNELENIDDVAMRALFDKEVRTRDTKLSYGEWFAMRLVNLHMGDADAIIFMSEGSLTGKIAVSNTEAEGSSPSPHATTQKERDTELKKTVLAGTKTQKTKNNTDKLKKSTVLDSEYDEAVRGITSGNIKLLVASLQRALGIGHNRATTYMDKMEADGIISERDSEGKRVLLIGSMTATEVTERMDNLCAGVTERNPDITMREGQINALEDVKPPISPPKLIELDESVDPKDITPAMFGLTPKQLQFCWEYIKDFNGARAIRDAGYGCKGVVAQSSQANENLKNPKLQHCMAQLMKLRRDRVKRRPSASELAKSADLVLERVAEMANYDINTFIKVGKDGLPFYDFSDATPEQMRGMTGLKIKQGVKMDFEAGGEPSPIDFYEVEAKGNPLKATELLMRHHGLMVERVEIKDDRDLSVKDVARRLAWLLEKAKREKNDAK